MEKERILVVDDELELREVVVALLEQAGYLTAQAGTASGAIQLLQQGVPCDAVLSDLMMPGTDGVALMHAIKQDFPETPVILMTGLLDLHIATDTIRQGAFDYLVKPVGRESLLSTVERALCALREQRRDTLYRTDLEEAVLERTQRLRSAMEDLERSYDVTLEAMGDALDLRDAETEGHSKRVTAYCVALARSMGVDADSLKVIARGAFLHDIGKIATPDNILLKPGKLTEDEMTIMMEHCRRGYDMVRKIPFLLEAAEIVLAHQEKFDGTGYPLGLDGENIPLGARIFAIADTLDAITSDRPYRKGASFQDAREEIERCSGRQFDPDIVDAFLALPREMWSEIRGRVGKNSHCFEVLSGAAA
jgi:putative nucleotidyltransferase with HDIG domain